MDGPGEWKRGDRRPFRNAAVLLATLVIAGPGCASHDAPAASPKEATAPVEETPRIWGPIDGPYGLRLTATTFPTPVRWGEDLTAILRLENPGPSKSSIPLPFLTIDDGSLVVEVKFEDGFPCEDLSEVIVLHAPGEFVADSGWHHEMKLQLNRMYRMTRVGRYGLRLGVDPSRARGKGAGTCWLIDRLEVEVGPPDESALDRMLDELPEDAPWTAYDPLLIESISDSGCVRLLPPLRALCARVERERVGGGNVPDPIAEAFRFAVEKIEILIAIQRDEWDRVRKYLDTFPADPAKPAARPGRPSPPLPGGRGDPMGARFREFLRIAYASRLATVEDSAK